MKRTLDGGPLNSSHTITFKKVGTPMIAKLQYCRAVKSFEPKRNNVKANQSATVGKVLWYYNFACY